MKEINIAKAIIGKRRERGMTQDDLACYIGVSKASVSKWETGQSYPDITLLPQLASYFNISIDELMGYEPQMGKEDIRTLYLRLSADFTKKPFDEVLGSCREITKKYFSCFPLLFHIGALLVNNSIEAGNMDQTFAVIEEAKELLVRVKQESEEIELRRLALNLEAFCDLMLGRPEEVIELLEGKSRKIISTESLLASAYQMTGRSRDAKSALQIGMYQNVCSLFGVFPDYLILYADEPEQFEKIHRRALALAEVFDLRHLHPSMLVKFHVLSAQGYAMLGNTVKALEILEEYTELVTGEIYPLQLKGDDFFNLIDPFFDELDLGTALPRDEKIIRKSMTDCVIQNPAFASMAGDRRFVRIVEKLKHNC